MGTLAGEVRGGSSVLTNGTITLTDASGGHSYDAGAVNSDGTFHFRAVPCGQYRLSVLNADGEELYADQVTVGAQGGILLVRLQQEKVERPPDGGVSVNELLHPPGKKAIQAFAAARKLSDAGDHQKAAEELEKAVRISPEYGYAWVNLAVQHLHLGLFEKGVEEIQRAARLTTPTALMYADLAFAQHALHHDDEGLAAARQAVRLDPTFAPGQYMLGYYLASDRRTAAESVRHLEIAAERIADARTLLNQLRRKTAQSEQSVVSK